MSNTLNMVASILKQKNNLFINCCKACFLSTFFIFLSTLKCNTTCDEKLKSRPYLDLYDEVVNLYFKRPYQKQKAISLLGQACSCNLENKDMTCYNLGVLHEIQNEKEKALIAYTTAYKHSPLPHYKLAMENLDLQISQKSNLLKSLWNACKKNDSQKAILLLTQASHTKNKISREVLFQPIFQDCMGPNPQYKILLEKFPSSSPKKILKKYHKEMAYIHPMYSIFDIELYLKKNLKKKLSYQKITRSWQLFIKASKAGNTKQASAHLQSLHIALAKISRKNHKKVKAMRRAIFVLITQDTVFRKIKDNPEIKNLLQNYNR